MSADNAAESVDELLQARDALIYYANTLEEERSTDRCMMTLVNLERAVALHRLRSVARAFRRWSVVTVIAAMSDTKITGYHRAVCLGACWSFVCCGMLYCA
jgi:hypothetical protein